MNFKDKIKSKRKKFTQGAIAEGLGVSQAAVSKRMSGAMIFRPEIEKKFQGIIKVLSK